MVKQNIRHKKILELIKLHGHVDTDTLVEYFKVTPQTIRRDLNELAEQNKLQRHHGGATLITSSAVNTNYEVRKANFLPEKIRIAHQVADIIPDGATLFIDIGTTAEIISHALMDHKNLRIITNNLHVATLFTNKVDFRLILAGGEVRHHDGGIVGEATIDFISQFRLDYGILGISGIDDDGSLLEFDYHEARVKRAIIENSRQTILASDHSKYKRNAMVNMGKISLVDYFVTDKTPPSTILDILHTHHIKLKIS